MTNEQEVRCKALELSMEIFKFIPATNPSLLLGEDTHKELKAQDFVIEHSKAFEKFLKEAKQSVNTGLSDGDHQIAVRFSDCYSRVPHLTTSRFSSSRLNSSGVSSFKTVRDKTSQKTH
jgi:hypothetical protein